jgi:hypothetical protein
MTLSGVPYGGRSADRIFSIRGPISVDLESCLRYEWVQGKGSLIGFPCVVAEPRFGMTACSHTAIQQSSGLSSPPGGLLATNRSLAIRDAGISLLATLTPLGGNTQDRHSKSQGGWIKTGGSARPHLKPQFPRVAGALSSALGHANEPLHGDMAGTSQHKKSNNSAEPVDSRTLYPVMELRP